MNPYDRRFEEMREVFEDWLVLYTEDPVPAVRPIVEDETGRRLLELAFNFGWICGARRGYP